MINTKWLNLIIIGLIVVLIILGVGSYILSRRPPEPIDVTPTPTFGPQGAPTPTLIQVPSPTFPATKLGTIQKILQSPHKFQDITIEYKTKTGTFVIFYQGNEAGAAAQFARFVAQNDLGDPRGLKTFYVSLDPIVVTGPPRGFE